MKKTVSEFSFFFGMCILVKVGTMRLCSGLPCNPDSFNYASDNESKHLQDMDGNEIYGNI